MIMGKHTICRKSRCYCYRAEGPQIIYCGLEITTIHKVFANKTDAKAFKEDYCQNDFESCPIYQMLVGDINGR